MPATSYPLYAKGLRPCCPGCHIRRNHPHTPAPPMHGMFLAFIRLTFLPATSDILYAKPLLLCTSSSPTPTPRIPNSMSSLTPASSNPFYVLFLQSIAVHIPARYLRSRLRQVPIALQLCKNIPSIIVFAFRLIVVPPPVSILRGFVDSNGALAFMLPSCDIALQLCAHIHSIYPLALKLICSEYLNFIANFLNAYHVFQIPVFPANFPAPFQ